MSFVPGGPLSVNHIRAAIKSCAELDDEIAAQPPPIVEFMGMDVLASDRGTWQTAWWPSRARFAGAEDGSDLASTAPWWGPPWITLGCNGRLSIAGTTRDQYGSALGACVVKLFRADNHELVAVVTSDPTTAAFIVTSPYSAAHYMVVHGPGGVAGATADTLIPV